MRKFKFLHSLYFLPLFFFTLAVSPNISGDRIGVVLVSVFLLLVPAANYIAANPGQRTSTSGKIKYSFIDFLSLMLFLVAIYLGWQINWQFNFLQCAYLFSVVLFSRQDEVLAADIKWYLARFLQGILLFAALYLGVNQYGFDNLFRIHILLYSFLGTLVIFTGLSVSKLHLYCLQHAGEIIEAPHIAVRPVRMIMLLTGLLLLVYSIFFITTYHWHYAVFFALAVLPSILLAAHLFRRFQLNKAINLPVRLNWLNILLATGLTVFFTYFFLDSSQVLQAVLGGY
jgi:hypothetical protein